MALPDLTGQNIENTYNRVVQTDGTFFYDGTGSLLNLGGNINTGSFATTGSNNFRGNQTISGSVRITNNAVITGSLTVTETDGNPRLDTSNGVLYRLGTASVDWRNRVLVNGAGSTTLDWENNQVVDTSTNPSIDWENRVLLDGTGIAESIDYDKRKLYNSVGDVILNYETGVLTGTASFAQTASYVTPLRQNVQITGSLSVSGSVIINNVDVQSTIVAMAIALG